MKVIIYILILSWAIQINAQSITFNDSIKIKLGSCNDDNINEIQDENFDSSLFKLSFLLTDIKFVIDDYYDLNELVLFSCAINKIIKQDSSLNKKVDFEIKSYPINDSIKINFKKYKNGGNWSVNYLNNNRRIYYEYIANADTIVSLSVKNIIDSSSIFMQRKNEMNVIIYKENFDNDTDQLTVFSNKKVMRFLILYACNKYLAIEFNFEKNNIEFGICNYEKYKEPIKEGTLEYYIYNKVGMWHFYNERNWSDKYYNGYNTIDWWKEWNSYKD